MVAGGKELDLVSAQLGRAEGEEGDLMGWPGGWGGGWGAHSISGAMNALLYEFGHIDTGQPKGKNPVTSIVYWIHLREADRGAEPTQEFCESMRKVIKTWTACQKIGYISDFRFRLVFRQAFS